jgi:hypothetical protein
MSDLQRVDTPKFRALYETAIDGQENDTGRRSYSVDAHFPHPNRIADPAYKKEVADFIKWASGAIKSMMDSDAKVAKVPNDQLLNPLRRGSDPTFAKYDGVEPEDFVIRLKSNDPITCVGPIKGADGKFPRLEKSDIYAGVFARSKVHLYAYNNKSKGVAFGCSSLQKLHDGDPLTSRGNPEADFEEVSPSALDDIDADTATSVDADDSLADLGIE